MKKVLIPSLVLAILALSLLARIVVYENSRLPGLNPFTNVCAFHYYVTKRVAEDGRLPAALRELQHPEGIEISKKTSVFMEYFIGHTYRIFAGISRISLDRFIKGFVRLFGIVPVIIVYFIAKTLTRNRIAGVISAAAYGFSPASIARTLGFGYLRENFALPFIFLHILFFIRALSGDEERPKWNDYNVWLSAIFFAIGLASWHFTQFYFVILLTSLLIAGVLYRARRVLRILLVTEGLAILTALFVPYLKELNFMTSLPMVYSYLVIAALLLVRRRDNNLLLRLALFTSPFIILLLFYALTLFKKDAAVYGHVYNLFIYSVRFLGQKPADPSLLPVHARLLWDASHRSLGWQMLLFYFGPILAVSAIPICRNCVDAIRGRIRTPKLALVFFTVVFFLLYFLVNRLMVFAIFFLSISVGLWYSLAGRFKKTHLLTALLSVFLCIELTRVLFMATDVRKTAYMVQLIGWIKENTAQQDVILASPRHSPDILAYTGRPIVLHAKLETKEIRDKMLTWAYSLFARDEEELYQLCRKWQAKYFVFARGTYMNTGGTSWRYVTDNMALDKKAVGYRMEAVRGDLDSSQFKHDGTEYNVVMSTGYPKPQLKHFLLVFQNPLFNVYKVKD